MTTASAADKGMSGSFGKNSATASKGNQSQFETQVFALVNKERAKAGAPALVLSKDVSNVARIKSEDMRDKKYFNHTSPTYGSPFAMLNRFGIKYRTAGENIAKGQQTPEAVMKAWMNSTGHRKNILDKNFKEIGIGCATDSSGTKYWTQQFVTR